MSKIHQESLYCHYRRQVKNAPGSHADQRHSNEDNPALILEAQANFPTSAEYEEIPAERTGI